MACRNNPKAKLKRQELIDFLGGKCALCGEKVDLEIDHPNGRNWDVRALSSYSRVVRYWQEALQGLIRVLCSTCNTRQAHLGKQHQPDGKHEDPF